MKILALVALIASLFACPSVAWVIVSDDGTQTNSTGIVDSSGDYHAYGLFDIESTFSSSGIVNENGYYRSSGVWDGEVYWQQGIIDYDENVDEYNYYSGGIFTSTYYIPQGILTFDGDTSYSYFQEGILDYDEGSGTFLYFQEGILDYDEGSGTFLYHLEGMMEQGYYYRRGIMTYDDNTYDFGYYSQGILEGVGTFHDYGIVDSANGYLSEGILDWDGSETYTHNMNGIFDGIGYFGITNAISSITGGEVKGSTIGTFTGTDNLTPEILKAGKTVDDVVGAAPEGGGGLNGSAILGMP